MKHNTTCYRHRTLQDYKKSSKSDLCLSIYFSFRWRNSATLQEPKRIPGALQSHLLGRILEIYFSQSMKPLFKNGFKEQSVQNYFIPRSCA